MKRIGRSRISDLTHGTRAFPDEIIRLVDLYRITIYILSLPMSSLSTGAVPPLSSPALAAIKPRHAPPGGF